MIRFANFANRNDFLEKGIVVQIIPCEAKLLVIIWKFLQGIDKVFVFKKDNLTKLSSTGFVIGLPV
jgi:hypothetical protein